MPRHISEETRERMREGGRKAAARNKAKYGPDFYSRIARLANHKGQQSGFATMTPEQRSAIGRKGGLTPKRPRKPKA